MVTRTPSSAVSATPNEPGEPWTPVGCARCVAAATRGQGQSSQDPVQRPRSSCRQTTSRYLSLDSTRGEPGRFSGTVTATRRVVRPSEVLRRRFSDGFQTGDIALAGAPRKKDELVASGVRSAKLAKQAPSRKLYSNLAERVVCEFTT
jgi:hypothetical protein